MKPFISTLLFLHFLVSHLVAAQVVFKTHVYPTSLRPDIFSMQTAARVVREKESNSQVVQDLRIFPYGESSWAETGVLGFLIFCGLALFLCVIPRFSYADILRNKIGPIYGGMNLTVQPPPSFRFWYALLDWYP